MNWNLFYNVIDLRTSTDRETTVERISEGVSIRGYNVWLLFCSAALASIGLDTNSTAVIIGAMLISPLMSPILGIGLSLGIHDRQLLLRSARNLVIAVVLSLIASVLYFSISPFANATAEIQARTFPILLDVLVALFGGVAGIISISRRGTLIALPGVAIATALMPPLCTAGYGIATLQWEYFGGAFYLFFINAVFISLATFLMVKYLGFPEITYRTKKQQRLSNFLFTMLIIIVTVPSVYFLFSVYKRERERKAVQQLVINRIKKQGNEIFKWDLVKQDSVNLVRVYYSGLPLSDSMKKNIMHSLQLEGLYDYQVAPQRVNLSREEIAELSRGAIRNMFQQMEMVNLKQEATEPDADTIAFSGIRSELKVLFPFVDSSYAGRMTSRTKNGTIDTLPVVFYSANRISAAQQNQMYNFLKLRLVTDSLVLIKK